MSQVNEQILLVSRPQGEASVDNFKLVQTPLPSADELSEGQVLVRHHYLSLDPYMRGRMNDSKSYAEPQPLNSVMLGGTVGEVLISKHPKFAVGDKVVGMGGWQTHSVVDATQRGALTKVDTTHIPLAKVPAAITRESLTSTLEIMLKDLGLYWNLAKPRILVTGLNPHAGESGDLGQEEIETISPVIQAMQAMGHDVQGPFPADTLFQPKYLQNSDAVLAMFHDQGLPVLKHASFGQGVNVSLGLPIIRTSVDHGTALDLAGTRNMDAGSLNEAIECAHHMDLCRGKAQ